MDHEKAAKEKSSSHLEYHHDASDEGLDAERLPMGYFKTRFYLGTMLASGLSVSAVCAFPQRRD